MTDLETKENEDFNRFIQLYIEEYGVTLTREKAWEERAKLRQLYRVVCLSPTDTQPEVK